MFSLVATANWSIALPSLPKQGKFVGEQGNPSPITANLIPVSGDSAAHNQVRIEDLALVFADGYI